MLDLQLHHRYRNWLSRGCTVLCGWFLGVRMLKSQKLVVKLVLKSSVVPQWHPSSPEGRPGMSVYPPPPSHPQPGFSGLLFDSTLLSTLLFFCINPVTVSIVSFVCPLVHSPEFFCRKLFNIFREETGFFFWYGSCLAVRSVLIGDMCSMLPYDTGICCMHLYNT